MPMTPASQILRAAREKIAVPERWTQKSHARDAQERWVAYDSREACKWCASAAIAAVCPGTLWLYVTRLLRLTPGFPAGNSIMRWNDAPDRTHAEVLAAFDAAIAAEEGRG